MYKIGLSYKIVVHGTVELSRRSVARALLFCKGRDTRNRSALMSCYMFQVYYIQVPLGFIPN